MDRLVATVSRIFKERYGTQLVIKTKMQTQQNTPVPIFRSHWPSAFVYSRTLRQVSFPIFNSKKELQALAIAHPVENKDAIIFDEMAQFLQLTIAEHMELSEEHLLSQETELAIRRSSRDYDNIIELKTKKRVSSHFEYKKTYPKREANLDPIWISDCSIENASQIAFSVHDWVNHWAFINAKEIPDLIWSDQTGWKNLSQVTIFVPDIHLLDTAQLETLKKNLSIISLTSQIKPLLIVSSQGSMSDELKAIKDSFFRAYETKPHVTPRIQAHFLLFHQQPETSWAYDCPSTNQVYYLPFSHRPETVH
jgi:hypothetical protein